jgi:hypothetical protein
VICRWEASSFEETDDDNQDGKKRKRNQSRKKEKNDEPTARKEEAKTFSPCYSWLLFVTMIHTIFQDISLRFCSQDNQGKTRLRMWVSRWKRHTFLDWLTAIVPCDDEEETSCCLILISIHHVTTRFNWIRSERAGCVHLIFNSRKLLYVSGWGLSVKIWFKNINTVTWVRVHELKTKSSYGIGYQICKDETIESKWQLNLLTLEK